MSIKPKNISYFQGKGNDYVSRQNCQLKHMNKSTFQPWFIYNKFYCIIVQMTAHNFVGN